MEESKDRWATWRVCQFKGENYTHFVRYTVAKITPDSVEEKQHCCLNDFNWFLGSKCCLLNLVEIAITFEILPRALWKSLIFRSWTTLWFDKHMNRGIFLVNSDQFLFSSTDLFLCNRKKLHNPKHFHKIFNKVLKSYFIID